MMKFLEIYIGAIMLWSSFYFIGRILFEEKEKQSLPRVIGSILIFSVMLSLLNMINSEILKGIIKIICVYSLYCAFYKIVFKKSWSKVIIASLILYICLCASEILIALTASIIFNDINSSLAFLKNTIVINMLVAIIELLIIRVGRKVLVPFVKNGSNLMEKSTFIIIFITLLLLALLGFRIPVNNWKLDIEFIVTMIIDLGICVVGILMLKQKVEIQKTTSMYQQLAEYSNITNNVLEEYRIVTHEHKNQLLIIRSMLDNKNKELNDYVDSLLDKREGIKYKWIGELNHLPLSGLKGLINYKILEMEALKLNKVISISKEVLKIKLDKLSINQKDNLYSIMGVYLDNAIQAATESKEKEVNIEIYKEKKELVIIIANTYKDKVELEKMDNYGYTTKGKNHGVGLHLVKNILQNDSTFTAQRYLLDNYFIQEVRINLKEIKTK